MIRREMHRWQGRIQRAMTVHLARRMANLCLPAPCVSFTFDDFPRSALSVGGSVLSKQGFSGTFYVSLSLMGRDSQEGPLFTFNDLTQVLRDGHELGCHTFDHCPAWETPPHVFESSVEANRRALSELVPGANFRTLSYPISGPRPATKQRMGARFLGCRGGGQRIQHERVDLNYLRSYFLKQRPGENETVKQLVDRTIRENGWLILSTHDIQPSPSPYGCTPDLFCDIVSYVAGTKCRVLSIAKVLEFLS